MAQALKMAEVNDNWREDFPIFQTKMNGKPLVYLDTASSAQKPQAVIDKLNELVNSNYSNIHRGLYNISQNLTEEYENVRNKIKEFINIPNGYDVIFTRNTTEAINLVAQSWGRTFLKEGDEVILSEMEHHANIVPWHLLKETNNIEIKFIPVSEDGNLDLEMYASLLSERTRLVAINHTSNSLGISNNINYIKEITSNFNPNIEVLIDGSQAVVHGAVDLSQLDVDFYAFTGHKLYGPTGAGILVGKHEVLQAMPPYQGGGDMIERVTLEGSTYKDAPHRFEAGTPAILEVIGLGAAVDYLRDIGMDNITRHEDNLLKDATHALKEIEGITIYGDTVDKAPIISFTADWGHISDIAMILDQCGVAVRSGHHCCMPLMRKLGTEGTVRASFGLYNNQNDIDIFIEGVKKARKLLS